MELQKLIRALRTGAIDNHRCFGCGYEHNCSIHGCRIMKLAADELERLQNIALDPDSVSRAEKQAVFRLGQMDMQQSVAAMLEDAAHEAKGLIRSTLLGASDAVKALEVTHADS